MLPVSLQANDATLVALSRVNLDGRPRPAAVVTDSTADSVVYQADNRPAVRSTAGGTVTSYEPGPNGTPLPQTPR
jgi:hypothetical protein